MSMNIKRVTRYAHEEKDRLGRTIHIYRRKTYYLSKQEAKKFKENNEKSNITL